MGKNYRLGGPLFIFRGMAREDLFGVLEKVTEIGFEGVEFVGLFGKEPREIRERLDALGMVAISNHVSVNEFYEAPEKIIADHKILGCKYITLAWPSRSVKYGMPEFDEIAGKVKKLCSVCYENGFTPIYHNHNYEFATKPSTIEVLMEICEKERLCLEPDLGWMAYSSVDPVDYLVKYRDRTPVIHLKDIYARDFSKIGPGVSHGGVRDNPDTGYFEFRPTGYGVMNYPKLLPYCLDCEPEWLIADHDLAYGRDSFEDMRLSYDYLWALLHVAGAADSK